MQQNLFSVIILLCAVLLGGIAVYAWSRRSTPGAGMFAYFVLAQTLYALGYSMELASMTLEGMLFWSRVEYIGIYSFPTLFLLFAIDYTGSRSWLARRKLMLFFLVPAILLAAKFLDPYTHLIYRQVWVDTSGPIPVLAFSRGPLYYAGGIYTLLMISSGVFLLWHKRRYSSPLYRSQATMIAVIAFTALVFYVLYLAGWNPVPGLKYIDPFAFSYAVWGLLIAWVLFRFRLFDLTPVAREALVEQLLDGVVVLDAQCRIVDSNPAALSIFGWKTHPIGQSGRQLLYEWIQLPESGPGESSLRMEVRRETPGAVLHYDVSLSNLKDKHGRLIGYLVVVHDITNQKENEQKLHDLSLVDDLTGLNNRRGFHLLATQLLSTTERLGYKAIVIYADMDNLKRINDTLGHNAGDQALNDTAQIFKEVFRASDVTARLGGDEFIAMAMETTDKTGEAILARIQQKIIAFNMRGARPYQLAVSFGLARCEPGEKVSLDALMDVADRAMYNQKQAKISL